MENDNRTFSPIKKKKRAFEEVALNIKEAIVKGVWKTGERLPAETELASQFGVSRHTIREALRTLELSGLLAIRIGVAGGPIVKDRIASSISNLYSDAFQMEKISIEELTAARVAIEKAILSEVLLNIDEEDVQNLKENINRAKQLIARKMIATSVNFEFHSLLARASKNKVFIILEKTINRIHQEVRSRNPVDFKTTRNVVAVHEKILNAVIKKEKKKAHQLLEDHIQEVVTSY